MTVNILDDDMIRFDPLVYYRFGRDNDVEDPLVSRMREIDDTVELGAFADIVWADISEKRQRFIVGAKVYQDENYADHYFGVNADNGVTSGLPFFSADGGINEYYAVVGANIYLNKNWLVNVAFAARSLPVTRATSRSSISEVIRPNG